MADIYKAYKVLNEVLGLKLTPEQLSRSEAFAKIAIAKGQGFTLSAAEAANVEAFTYFRPRKGKALVTRSALKAPTVVARAKRAPKGG